jgi:hypothetical protein
MITEPALHTDVLFEEDDDSPMPWAKAVEPTEDDPALLALKRKMARWHMARIALARSMPNATQAEWDAAIIEEGLS